MSARVLAIMALISACSAWGTANLSRHCWQVVEKGFPSVASSDHQMLVHFLHGTAGVLLRPTAGPADHFRDEILEACGGNTMMSLIYPWVRIQARVGHDAIDEVIHDGGDAVDTAEPLVKAGRIRLTIGISCCFRFAPPHFPPRDHVGALNLALRDRVASEK